MTKKNTSKDINDTYFFYKFAQLIINEQKLKLDEQDTTDSHCGREDRHLEG